MSNFSSIPKINLPSQVELVNGAGNKLIVTIDVLQQGQIVNGEDSFE